MSILHLRCISLYAKLSGYLCLHHAGKSKHQPTSFSSSLRSIANRSLPLVVATRYFLLPLVMVITLDGSNGSGSNYSEIGSLLLFPKLEAPVLPLWRFEHFRHNIWHWYLVLFFLCQYSIGQAVFRDLSDLSRRGHECHHRSRTDTSVRLTACTSLLRRVQFLHWYRLLFAFISCCLSRGNGLMRS